MVKIIQKKTCLLGSPIQRTTRMVFVRGLLIISAVAFVFAYGYLVASLQTRADDGSIQRLGWKTIGWCDLSYSPYRDRLWLWNLLRGEQWDFIPSDVKIPLDVSGYCNVMLGNGALQQAFHQSCASKPLRNEQQSLHFQCSMVPQFMQYKTLAWESEPKIIITTNDAAFTTAHARGIVMQVYPKVLPSLYAIIQLLRKDHLCTLPIELWANSSSVFQHPVLEQLLQLEGMYQRTIDDPHIQEFMTKPYSIAYSSFQEVLFLDSDNFPIRDPSYLFETKEYQETGALFWKDYWSPARDEFFIRKKSVLWELLGITDAAVHQEMEMESGQIVIDRSRSHRALKILLYFVETFDQWFHPMGLIHGDKDLFRLAWHFTDTPFHYIKQPPGLAGYVNHRYPDYIVDFLMGFYRTCGLTMVQHDPAGDPLFLHRNAAKLTTRESLVHVWDQIEVFVGTQPEVEYAIGEFYDDDRRLPCYGPKASLGMYFQTTNLSSTRSPPFPSLATLEAAILEYAGEAFDLMEKQPPLA